MDRAPEPVPIGNREERIPTRLDHTASRLDEQVKYNNAGVHGENDLCSCSHGRRPQFGSRLQSIHVFVSGLRCNLHVKPGHPNATMLPYSLPIMLSCWKAPRIQEYFSPFLTVMGMSESFRSYKMTRSPS